MSCNTTDIESEGSKNKASLVTFSIEKFCNTGKITYLTGTDEITLPHF